MCKLDSGKFCESVGASAEGVASGRETTRGEVASGREAALDEPIALQLSRLTTDFYAENADSFSETRATAWAGWERLLEEVAPAMQSQNPRVLDLACGNMRFARFLADRLPQCSIEYLAADNCSGLAGANNADVSVKIGNRFTGSFQQLDIISSLAASNLAVDLAVCDKSCDLAVAFGFMHHIPLAAWRREFLQALAAKVRPGGYVAVSFWRFMSSPKLAKKAQATTAQACAELSLPELPENDYLLGWQQTRGSYRYCHHFDEAEIASFEQALGPRATLAARYQADGKPGNLNEYSIWQVC